MAYRNYIFARGFSLIEVLVVAAILLLFFTGLFGSVRYTLALVSDSKAKLTALTVANDQMEYIRSLSYDAVGTVAGIPAGLIPQISTSSLNAIEFQTRVLIEYIDAAADGIGVADSNGITTDYKQAKVSVTWNSKGVAREVFLVSNIIPRSIETSVGGGTLRVNVFDSTVTALPGASVRLVNETLSPAIDITRFTDASGVALFGGAPAGPDYQVFVTAPGYSSDQTYFSTTTLPNPTTQPVAVVEADVSTLNFFIDELSDVSIQAYSDRIEQVHSESFSDTTGISTSSNVAVTLDTLQLQDSAGVYVSSGTAVLDALAPSPLQGWSSLSLGVTVQPNTSVVARLYAGTTTDAIISDSDLPGNGSGFAPGIVDLSGLDAGVYPIITIALTLSTASSTLTPIVQEVVMQYIESSTSVGGIDIEMVGGKTIGTNSSSEPIFKTTLLEVTDAGGVARFPDTEWDAYTIDVPGYDIAEACPANPLIVNPGQNVEGELVLATDTAHSLRVVVQTLSGAVLSGAEVTLSRPGYSELRESSVCGQVFFSGLSTALDYTLTVAVNGYTTQVLTGQSIENDIVTVVQF